MILLSHPGTSAWLRQPSLCCRVLSSFFSPAALQTQVIGKPSQGLAAGKSSLICQAVLNSTLCPTLPFTGGRARVHCCGCVWQPSITGNMQKTKKQIPLTPLRGHEFFGEIGSKSQMHLIPVHTFLTSCTISIYLSTVLWSSLH